MILDADNPIIDFDKPSIGFTRTLGVSICPTFLTGRCQYDDAAVVYVSRVLRVNAFEPTQKKGRWLAPAFFVV